MSSPPKDQQRKRVTLTKLAEMRALGEPIVMITAYDHPSAVRRGLKAPMLVGDLPFGSYEASDSQAIETAHRFVKDAGVDAVKLEGGGGSAGRARARVRAR